MRKRKKTEKEFNLLVFLILASIGFLATATAFLVVSPKPEGKVSLNHFTGTVLNQDFQGRLSGVVRADTNCTPTGKNNLTCTAIIDTQIGALFFTYTHNMADQPCLATNDQVDLEYLGSGVTKVTRSRG